MTATEATPGTGRAWWRTLLLGWLAAFATFVCTAHGSLETADSGFTLLAARGLWQRGDSALRAADDGALTIGEAAAAAYIRDGHGNGKVGVDGRPYVWFPMGHVFLLVPVAALADSLPAASAAADRALREAVAPGASEAQLASQIAYVYGQPALMQGLVAFAVPPLCGAALFVLLLQIARALGANGRDAAIAAVLLVFTTQAFALGRESLSDGPGLAFLLGLLLVTVRVHTGVGGARPGELVLGGVAAGCAVLLRYQAALLVLPCVVALALALHRRGQLRRLGWLVLGGLPFLGVMLSVDQARFGNPLDTGYPKYDDWFDAPIWVGLPKLLLGAGRGALWLSPILWLVLPLAATRRGLVLRWLGWVVFAIPMLMFAKARGWQGGQCWGARYVTPGIVVLAAIALPQLRPWRQWPRWTAALALFGAFACLTSVVAPTRGYDQLAGQAVAAAADAELAAGRLSPEQRLRIDHADVASWQPRYSALLANWRYAFASRVGGFEDARGQPLDGSERTIEAVFGIVARTPEQAWAPRQWADRRGRHLWWRYWGDLSGLAGGWLVAPFAALALAAWWAFARRIPRQR